MSDTAQDPETPAWSAPLRVADLAKNRPTAFSLRPSAKTLAALADFLGLQDLRKLTFKGEISPMEKRDWRLDGRLGATVAQNCVVTLAPVTTRIEETVTRIYTERLPEFEAGSEVEMPDDDATEPLAPTIDPGIVMAEALALALPLFPRAPGAELDEAGFTEPGKTPMSDDDARPFAGLKSLRDKLAGDAGDDDR